MYILWGVSALGKLGALLTYSFKWLNYFAGALVPFHRYSRGGYDHLYTVNTNEIGTITPGSIGRNNYVYEGPACQIYAPSTDQPSGTLPFYRYYNNRDGQHFYTTNWKEIGTNVSGVKIGDWTCEGVAGYIDSSSQPGTVPFYRYYQIQKNAHFYTKDASEIGTVVSDVTGKYGYKYEGIAGYVFP